MQYVLSLYVAVFAVVFGVLNYVLKDAPEQKPLLAVAGALLLLASPIGAIVSGKIMEARYDLYVSSVIFAAQLHDAAGFGTHRWFEYIKDYMKTIPMPLNKDALLHLWKKDRTSTFAAYRLLVRGLAAASFITGLALVVAALTR